jgi:hypothetical protein
MDNWARLKMRIAISHPGKIGDLLMALPTGKYLSERHGCKVDVYTSPYCRGAIDLIACQPYVNRAIVLEEYVMEHTLWGAQPWKMPVPEHEYDAVYQLGFREFPDRHCVRYVAHIAGLPEPDPESFRLEVPDTGIVERLGLSRPYVLVTTHSSSGGGGLTSEWSTAKVAAFIKDCPHHVYGVGLEDELRAYPSQDRFTALTGRSLLEVAEVIKNAHAVVTYSTGLGVIASGVLNGSGVRVVCMFDGEVSWELFRLAGVITCSPDEDLPAIVFRRRSQQALERDIAGVERDRRSFLKTMRDALAARAQAESLAADLTAQLAAARQRLDVLEPEADALRRGMAGVESSLSWRITKPLRSLRDLMAGRKQA